MKKKVVCAANWLIIREMVKFIRNTDDIQETFTKEVFHINNNYYYEIQNGHLKGEFKLRKIKEDTGINPAVFDGTELLEIGIPYEEFEQYYEVRMRKKLIREAGETEEAYKKRKQDEEERRKEAKEPQRITAFQRRLRKQIKEILWKEEECTPERLGGTLYAIWYYIARKEKYDENAVKHVMEIVDRELGRMTWKSLKELPPETLEAYCQKLDKYREQIHAVKVYLEMKKE